MRQAKRHTSAVEQLELRRLLSQWTFMVYMDGDNNLESMAVGDFLEMAAVGSTADVKIVVQFDRIPGYDTQYGNWTDTRRGLINAGDTPTSSWGAGIGEANMGDPATLSSFVNWATTTYPSDHYSLLLWDHGGGWRSAGAGEGAGAASDADLTKGVCWDDTDGDYLETREVRSALQAIAPNMDVFGHDACLMGMIECAYEVRNEATVYVGSEKTIPGTGFPYTAICNDLKSKPAMTAEELGVSMVTRYGASYGGDETLSAFRLSGVSALAGSMNAFATALISAPASDLGQMQTHRNNAPSFSEEEYRDLGYILAHVSADAVVSSAVRTAATSALSAYNAALIRNHSSAEDAGTGLSIYFQAYRSSKDSQYNSGIIQFAADTQWDEFLTVWATGVSGPDLVGTSFSLAATSMIGLSSVNATFTVGNIGSLGAGAFDVEFFFSDVSGFNSTVVAANLSPADPLYNAANPNAVRISSLATGGSATFTISLVVPSGAPVGTDGACFLGIRVDEGGAIAETDEGNNFGRGPGLDYSLSTWQATIYSRNMDANPGWTYQGAWAWGTPTGGGGAYGGPDPTSGATGTKVVGYNLSGDYTNSMPQYYTTTGVINCTGYLHTQLSFYRWLGVEQPTYDHAAVQVYNGSSWTTIWQNTTEIVDTGWVYCTYNISAYADNRSNVQVRWSIGTTDSSWTYCGWNIDDVVIFGDSNASPTGLALSSTSVAENQPAGAAVGNFSSIDPDAGNTFTYTLVSGTGSTDNASFTIVGNQLRTAAVFDYEAKNSYAIRVRTTDQGGLWYEDVFTIAVTNVPEATITARQLFYNRSSFDGNDPAATAADDNAIATDKSALLPGQTATFANYSSYSRGLNGLMLDLSGFVGNLTASDFTFKVGNNSDPSAWAAAPAPVSLTQRALPNGNTRVTLIWADNAIQKQWLQVTVLAGDSTDLATADTFYFGNAIGECGNASANAQVTTADEAITRNNQSGLSTVPITSLYDYNRDGRVNSQDLAITRGNRSGLSPLQLITPPAGAGASIRLSAPAPLRVDASSSAWWANRPLFPDLLPAESLLA